MSARAIILGLLIGLGVSAFAHFNDQIIRSTPMVGSFLPAPVYGSAVLLAVFIGPALGMIRRRWALRPAEVAITVAVALASCGYPGSGFWRYAGGFTAMPAHWAWGPGGYGPAGLLSFAPDADGRIVDGQVRDWQALAAAAVAAGEGGNAAGDDDAVRVLAHAFELSSDPQRRVIERIAVGNASTAPDAVEKQTLLQAVNQALEDPQTSAAAPRDEWQRVRTHRRWLDAALPDVLVPMPPGDHAYLADLDTHDPLVRRAVVGDQTGQAFRPTGPPWPRLMPTLLLWGGAVLVLGLGTLCLAMIVHPQWSRHERLAYPLPKVVQQLAARSADRVWPDIAYSRLFWLGLGIAAVLHLINGLHVWFETPSIPLHFNFNPLRELFPKRLADQLLGQLLSADAVPGRRRLRVLPHRVGLAVAGPLAAALARHGLGAPELRHATGLRQVQPQRGEQPPLRSVFGHRGDDPLHRQAVLQLGRRRGGRAAEPVAAAEHHGLGRPGPGRVSAGGRGDRDAQRVELASGYRGGRVFTAGVGGAGAGALRDGAVLYQRAVPAGGGDRGAARLRGGRAHGFHPAGARGLHVGRRPADGVDALPEHGVEAGRTSRRPHLRRVWAFAGVRAGDRGSAVAAAGGAVAGADDDRRVHRGRDRHDEHHLRTRR